MEILAGNRNIMDLLTMCGGQWQYGFDGPTGLNWQTIITVADRIGIKTDETFFEKLRAFESAALAEIRKEKPE